MESLDTFTNLLPPKLQGGLVVGLGRIPLLRNAAPGGRARAHGSIRSRMRPSRRGSELRLTAVLLLFMSSAARGADVLDPPPASTLVNPSATGRWALYRVSYPLGKTSQDVKVALVKAGARQAVWELSVMGPVGKTLTIKKVVALAGGRLHRLSEQIMQHGTEPPTRLPFDVRSAEEPFRTPRTETTARKETIETPTGERATDKVSVVVEPGRGYDFWFARDALPTGVVKFEEWTQGGNGVRLIQERWEMLESGGGAVPTIRRPARDLPPRRTDKHDDRRGHPPTPQ